MTETKRKRAPGAGGAMPGAGRPALPDCEKKQRVELYLDPTLAAFLNADDIPPGTPQKRTMRRRRREAAEMLLKANIESRIL